MSKYPRTRLFLTPWAPIYSWNENAPVTKLSQKSSCWIENWKEPTKQLHKKNKTGFYIRYWFKSLLEKISNTLNESDLNTINGPICLQCQSPTYMGFKSNIGIDQKVLFSPENNYISKSFQEICLLENLRKWLHVKMF